MAKKLRQGTWSGVAMLAGLVFVLGLPAYLVADAHILTRDDTAIKLYAGEWACTKKVTETTTVTYSDGRAPSWGGREICIQWTAITQSAIPVSKVKICDRKQPPVWCDDADAKK